jgi:hypothetical protein
MSLVRQKLRGTRRMVVKAGNFRASFFGKSGKPGIRANPVGTARQRGIIFHRASDSRRGKLPSC